MSVAVRAPASGVRLLGSDGIDRWLPEKEGFVEKGTQLVQTLVGSGIP